MTGLDSVHTRVLAHAAALLGGRAALRAWLRVSMRDLDAWMSGAVRTPAYIFLKAVDLLDADSARIDALRSAADVLYKSNTIRARAQEAVDKAVDVRRRSELARERSRHILECSRETLEAMALARSAISAGEFAAVEFSATEPGFVLHSALNAALNSTEAERANVQLVAPDGLHLVAHIGFEQPFLEFFSLVTCDTPSCCRRAHEDGKRVIVADVATDPVFAGTDAGRIMLDAHAAACQSTPLVGASGELLGMLSTHYEAPHEPTASELAALDLVCQRASRWLDGSLPA